MKRKRSMSPVFPTNAEQSILGVLWEIGEGTVENIVDRLPSRPPANYKTVQSLLRIMGNKGFVTHTVKGRAFVFRPRISREAVGGGMTKHLLERTFRGSHYELVMNLLDANPVKNAELDELEALIHEYRKRQRLGEPPE